jgi:hypothetical protein
MSTLQSHYNGALEKLRHTILAVSPHRVIDIQPESNRCLESYPCGGHGDAIVVLDNGTVMRVPCSSVEMGALMWHFKCGSKHLTEYIDDAFARYLSEHLHG